MSRLKAKFYFRTSPDRILDQLKSFPNRYKHHRSLDDKGIWEYRLFDSKQNKLTFQLIDKTFVFDTSKGSQKSEASVIVMETESTETGTKLSVSLRWLPWKTVLLTFPASFLIAFFSFMAFAGEFEFVFLFTALFILITDICAIIAIRKHDILAFNVFIKLLNKNFGKEQDKN